jgi:hypothetical protein
MSPQDVHAQRDGLRPLDVREALERAAAHVEGALQRPAHPDRAGPGLVWPSSTTPSRSRSSAAAASAALTSPTTSTRGGSDARNIHGGRQLQSAPACPSSPDDPRLHLTDRYPYL